MKRDYHIYVMSLLLLVANGLWAQTKPEQSGRIESGKLVLTVDADWNTEQRASFSRLYDVDTTLLKKIFAREFKFIHDSAGWEVKEIRSGKFEITRKLISENESSQLSRTEILSGTYLPPPPPPAIAATDEVYGINTFNKFQSFVYKDGRACFIFKGNSKTGKVVLSGSFNNWSTAEQPMQLTDSGWVACINLSPGKYYYKFIVDGRWMHDPENKTREKDGHRGWNSVAFCYNYSFVLEGFQNAKSVVVAGSFNGWNNREIKMNKTRKGWERHLYLREGTHAYKFIVDGNWITDPKNAVLRKDDHGNENSFMAIGDTMYFILNGFKNAKQVNVAGSFNAWQNSELKMMPTDEGWILPYVMAAGNYEYKFIADGKWMTDPDNPNTSGSGDFENSILVVKPNHVFTLKGFEKAEEVLVTGTFNNWNTHGMRMSSQNGVWLLPAYLKPGRYSYKFVVDGQWIIDPDNPYYEENQFGTGNSVLWIE
jgi:hypothetical protein